MTPGKVGAGDTAARPALRKIEITARLRELLRAGCLSPVYQEAVLAAVYKLDSQP